MLTPFQNEPFGNFDSGDRRTAMQRAIRHVAGQLGATYPLIIGGERIVTERKLPSINPAEPKKLWAMPVVPRKSRPIKRCWRLMPRSAPGRVHRLVRAHRCCCGPRQSCGGGRRNWLHG